ncbi:MULTISPECIES: TraR/DksA C4-type zinc finger protein [Exiguobacterium]|uniref:TraR/DksA C4-type zinc finger protein n=1 Tax=Exiguobacterium TaxID=33986 RepID=UPI000478941C|nr:MULTISPECIES: TraR/DksA C4-type zinc finger protein [Exiguobacterium]MCK2157065.1 TraR/DksA C4-type zinc finger protein [Exiguobacterium sp. 17-1]
MLSEKQIETFKTRLLKEKNKTETNIENREVDYDTGELSSYDNHPGDSGDELFLRERDQAMTDMQEEMLSDVDLALKAIEDGTYGVCKVCGKDIEIERLDIIPETLLCIEDAKKEEEKVGNDPMSRPSEEAVLDPSVTATGKDIDGATDGFSKVGEFGNSDTPSDKEDGIDPTR